MTLTVQHTIIMKRDKTSLVTKESILGHNCYSWMWCKYEWMSHSDCVFVSWGKNTSSRDRKGSWEWINISKLDRKSWILCRDSRSLSCQRIHDDMKREFRWKRDMFSWAHCFLSVQSNETFMLDCSYIPCSLERFDELFGAFCSCVCSCMHRDIIRHTKKSSVFISSTEYSMSICDFDRLWPSLFGQRFLSLKISLDFHRWLDCISRRKDAFRNALKKRLLKSSVDVQISVTLVLESLDVASSLVEGQTCTFPFSIEFRHSSLVCQHYPCHWMSFKFRVSILLVAVVFGLLFRLDLMLFSNILSSWLQNDTDLTKACLSAS